ncbi:hypothetical protein [Actinoplanes regularis]|uniref:hypothetical protein n=1 Tax=Actinoplanes regularis TaxID=52697 RepID=UPI0024A574DD|nr:hypothetical protein [Actinoplanes regularis]GLW31874.1 hypothetical protein Areg01_48130 [Actinoplanes regularis]
MTENQAGSTALLLLGGIGVLMSITGRVPDRMGKEGVNYEPVDEAAKAIQNVLTDEALPFDVKEAVAAALREELDKRQFADIRSIQRTYPTDDRLSRQADYILFEAAIRDVILDSLPAEAEFIAAVRVGHNEFDGLIGRSESILSNLADKIAIEVIPHSKVRLKVEKELQRLISLKLGGAIFVARAMPIHLRLETVRWFEQYIAKLGQKNFHLVFLEDSEEAVQRLRETVSLAWARLTGAAESGGDPAVE